MTSFRFWRRRRRNDADFAAEIDAHLALEADRLVGQGHDPAHAATEARRRFGNVGGVQERFYEASHIMWLDDLRRDVHYATRTLAKDKGYVLSAIAALGLGLAANIALFSLFSAVALKPLPVPAPDRLVAIYQDTPTRRFAPFSVGDYFFYRDHSRSFSNIAAGQPSHLRLASVAASGRSTAQATETGGVAEPVIALFVTANFFDTFGVHPIVGRPLRPNDETPTGVFSALISDNYWERRFGRDPGIIGSTLLVSGIRAMVVGVSPRDFAGLRQEVPDLWISLAALGDLRQRAASETTTCCELVGRLAAGVSVQQARTELAGLAAEHARALPASERLTTVTVGPAVPFGRLADQIRVLFVALQVAMLLVLLVACGNVAGLLLSRAVARQREIAVRLATGASGARLVRQLVTEGIVVAVVAGVVAAAVTVYGLRAATHIGAEFLARQGGGTVALRVAPNAGLLLYVAVISIGAGIAFALAPALQVSRTELVSALKSTIGDGPRRGALRRWLVAAQIALTVALLVTAGGLARSAVSALRIDPGFKPHGVLTVWLTNPQELGLPAARAREIEAVVRERLRALPDVEQLAVASRLPLGGNVTVSAMLPAERAGDPVVGDAATRYPYTFVSDQYLTTLGIPLRRGRMFTAQEARDGSAVAIVSDSVARTLWPNGDAIGHRLALATAHDVGGNSADASLAGSAEVIGVAGDVRALALAVPSAGDVYLPKLTNGWSSRILLRMRGDVARATREIPRIVHDIEPALPVSVQPMDDVVALDFSVVTARVGAAIFAVIGVLGLFLALLGVYGMVSYTVRQQQREIGIRMALGAQAHQVLRSMLHGPVSWMGRGVIAGMLLGVAGIKITNTLLQGALVDARAVDPPTLALVPVAIIVVALLASFLSARRAMSMDPAVVLRSDG